MEKICFTCNDKIDDKRYITCKKPGCLKKFHLLCIGNANVPPRFRSKWLCTECYTDAVNAAKMMSVCADLKGLNMMNGPGTSSRRQMRIVRAPRVPPGKIGFGSKKNTCESHQIEITGLVNYHRENSKSLEKKILLIGELVGARIVESDIEMIYRLQNIPIYHELDYSTVLVVHFKRVATRNLFVQYFQQYRHKITNRDISMPNTITEAENKNDWINVTDRLCARNRHIYTMTRHRCYVYGYEYCWISNGVVFIRKHYHTDTIKITSLVKLNKVLPVPTDDDTGNDE